MLCYRILLGEWVRCPHKNHAMEDMRTEWLNLFTHRFESLNTNFLSLRSRRTMPAAWQRSRVLVNCRNRRWASDSRKRLFNLYTNNMLAIFTRNYKQNNNTKIFYYRTAESGQRVGYFFQLAIRQLFEFNKESPKFKYSFSFLSNILRANSREILPIGKV